MSRLLHTLAIVGLGLFWGLSPTLYRLMSDAGIPITHVVVLSGLAVGLGLTILQLLRREPLGITRRSLGFGVGCGLLMTIPWAFSLFLITKVPVTVYAVISSTAPLVAFALALAIGRERASLLRLAALSFGFVSSVVLILTRGTTDMGEINLWAIVAFVNPLLYAFYNLFAASAWPKGLPALTAGVLESFASAALMLPAMLLLAPIVSLGDIHWGYWTVGIASLLWTIERIAFFMVIRESGPVDAMQAVYVSTPSSVVFGVLLFGERTDLWLWLSLGLLMLALMFNTQAMRR